MLITTDTGIKEDTVIYGIGGKDVFLPLSMFSYILNLDVDSSVKSKPLLYSKDKSVYVELNVDSVLATVNGEDVVLPHEVYEHNGIVLIPVKYLASKFGYTVKDTYNNIHISKRQKEEISA